LAQSAPHVFRGAMPRAQAPDLEELSLIDDDEEEQGAVGAVASIQAAARKGTRPRIVKFVFVTSTRHDLESGATDVGKGVASHPRDTSRTNASRGWTPLGAPGRGGARRPPRRGLCPRASAS
jgi:hypothetical protein